jgi:hypothetical protein
VNHVILTSHGITDKMTGLEYIKTNSRSGVGKHTMKDALKTLNAPKILYSGVGLLENLLRPFGW